jgi:hypothetical protein
MHRRAASAATPRRRRGQPRTPAGDTATISDGKAAVVTKRIESKPSATSAAADAIPNHGRSPRRNARLKLVSVAATNAAKSATCSS